MVQNATAQLKRDDFKHPKIRFTEGAEVRLLECIEYVNSQRPDLAENLKFQFSRHGYYFENHPEIEMRVMKDFAPLSFYFEMLYYNPQSQKIERDYNGGIIFHGKHDGGGNGGAPTFSVNLTPVDGWSTHT
jgi:hypothetical protein